jgi:hypothetical protein
MLKDTLNWLKIEQPNNIFQHHENHCSPGEVRDGNGGIDLKINFLPLQAVDDPNSCLGGETLLEFGEVDFTSPVLFRVSGVSSSGII